MGVDLLLQADAVLHFGTHGSLEFMPGKQVSFLSFLSGLLSALHARGELCPTSGLKCLR